MYLVGPIHLELDGHLGAGGVLPGGRVHQVLVLVVGVVSRHHGVQHHAGVADAQAAGPLPLQLQAPSPDSALISGSMGFLLSVVVPKASRFGGVSWR